MNMDPVIATIKAHEYTDNIAPDWPDAMSAMPDSILPFLTPRAIEENCRWCGIDAGKVKDLATLAGHIAEDAHLSAWAWYCHWRLFKVQGDTPPGKWPDLRPVLNDRAGAFYLLIGLSIVDPMRHYHQHLGIPEQVTRDTCLQVSCYCGNHERGFNGQSGLYINQLQWLYWYVRKPFLRLGRMEYEIREFDRKVIRVFRNRKTGHTIALAEDGVRFNREGYIAREDIEADMRESWTARLRVEEDRIEGNLVSPRGMALERKTTLNMSDWQCVIESGTPILSMHIPAGGNMSPEACRDSLQQAADFFPRHFPDRNLTAIDCSSWLFNTQLEKILRPTSNLLKFQRELYLYPVPSSGVDGLWFIFLQDKFDPKTAPRDTSLQRSILDFIEAGNTWRGGGMFILMDDVGKYGTGHYRAMWEQETAADA